MNKTISDVISAKKIKWNENLAQGSSLPHAVYLSHMHISSLGKGQNSKFEV